MKLFLILFSLPAFLFAQKKGDIINESTVDSIKKLRVDDKYFYYNSKSVIEFNVDKNTADPESNILSAIEQNHNSCVPLKSGAKVVDYIFYDEKSLVLDISSRTTKGKPLINYVLDEKYQQQGIFYDDGRFVSVAFDFPNLECRALYDYQKIYADLKYMTTVYFHNSCYTYQRTVSFVIPDWLNIEIKEFNFDGYDIVKKIERKEKEKSSIITYVVKNLKPLKNEDYAVASARCMPHLLLLYKSYSDKDKTVELFNSVQNLYSWYHNIIKNVNNDIKEIKPFINELTKDCKTVEEKISKLFFWVQDNIRYIAFEKGIMGFKPTNADQVFSKRYGDCKGMANLLKTMYKEIGLDARLCWIGTNDIPYDYSTPSLQVDNHMICAVNLNKKWIFIDGTESYIGMNEYAERIQGKQVLIEDGDNYVLERIPESDFNKNALIISSSSEINLSENTIKGKSNCKLSGEYKTMFFRKINYSKTEERDKSIKSTFSFNNRNLKIASFNAKNIEDRNNDIDITLDFELKNQITQAGNEIYIGFEIEQIFSEMDFDTSRITDIDLDFERIISSTASLKCPEGYKIDYLPEPLKIENINYTFNLSFSTEGSIIVYKRVLIIKKPTLKLKDLSQWNSDIKKLKKIYKDQIVLIKI